MPVDYLITGAAGMIGRQIDYGRKLTRSELDVTSPGQVAAVFEQLQPRTVLHLAALNLQQGERDPELAQRINVFGTETIARACARHGARLVYVSTGTVFWGVLGQAFSETDTPQPRHIYGRTKLAAEQVIRELVSDHLIVRTGWLFGGSGAHHRKFVDIILGAIAARQPVQAHQLQTGSPTSVVDFCRELKRFADSPQTGLLHLVNSGIATPRDIARFVLARHQAEDLLAPAPPGLGPDRSPSEALISSTVTLRPWQEALADYLRERQPPEFTRRDAQSPNGEAGR